MQISMELLIIHNVAPYYLIPVVATLVSSWPKFYHVMWASAEWVIE